MKNIKFILIVLLSTVFCMESFSQNQGADSILTNIQDKIYTAFIASFKNQNISELQKIQKKIQDLHSNNIVVTYWIPYSKYYESIYYLKTKDAKNAEEAIEEGIDYLYKTKNKNSESYALLAHLQSFSIQFEKGMSVIGVSKRVLENAEKALELNPNNPRAWYVMACNDYYKPKQYGGGKKTEEYLLKAIKNSEAPTTNPYLPTWGVSDAYALLIGYYLENENKEKAKETFEKGVKLFPSDYMINQYASQFK